MRILGVCGSLQAESTNLDLLRLAQASAEDLDERTEVVLYNGLRDLPFFNPDIKGVPPTVARWKAAIVASDAVLFATPEYGHSLPGVLKNAIDWTIDSGELGGKLVAITASAAGPGRGAMGLQALAQTLGAVSARIAYNSPIVRGDAFLAEVTKVMEALVAAGKT